MTRAGKLCSHVDTDGPCPNLQPCPVHARKPWADSTRRSRLPPGWDKLRASILERDPICKVCDQALSVEVDHITPNDDHQPENLQGICVDCHRRKTQQEATRARRRQHHG